MNRRRANFIAFSGVLLALVCLLLYTNTLGGDFVSDDLITIEQNQLITSAHPWYEILRKPFPDEEGMTYRPLTNLISRLDYKIWNLDPYGYHLTNIILHILCTLAVLWLFTTLLQTPSDISVILLGSAFFACHPIHTEAVAWISGRSEILAALWATLSLTCYAKWRLKMPIGAKDFSFKILPWLILSLIFYMLALLSKESGATVILLVPLYDLLLAPRTKNFNLKTFFLKDFLLPYFLFVLLLCGYLIIRLCVLSQFILPEEFTEMFLFNKLSSYGKVLTVAKIFAFYIWLLVAPINLCLTHLLAFSESVFEVTTFLSVLIVLFIIGIATLSCKKAPYLSFGLFWAFVALLPVSHLVPIGVLLGERFLYIPSIGFCLAAAWLLALLWRIPLTESMARIVKVAVTVFVVLILLVFSFRTVDRNRVWENHYTLFSDVVEKYPNSYRGHVGLASYYEEQGLLEDARRHYAIAFSITGPSVHIVLPLSRVEVKMGNLANAVQVLRMALVYKPDDPRIHYNLMLIYRAMGEEELAKEHEKFSVGDPDIR